MDPFTVPSAALICRALRVQDDLWFSLYCGNVGYGSFSFSSFICSMNKIVCELNCNLK